MKLFQKISLRAILNYGIALIGVLGTAFFIFTLATNLDNDDSSTIELCRDRSNAEVKIDDNEFYRLTINEDTLRRIYLFRDTTSSIIWIGIGGKIITK